LASKYDYVKEGQIIGTSGRSGTSQGYYDRKGGYELHFEVIQSYKELDWVRTGPLDFHSVSEDKRTDPEIFLSHSSSRYAIEYKGKYSVDLGDGTTITSDGLIVEHRDSNDKLLKTALRGAVPSSGFWTRTSHTVNYLFGMFDQADYLHHDFAASAQNLDTKEGNKKRNR
jgi:murein DD-endopeptidase MepM/ murein hydrolase activator NlpD